MNRSTRKTQKTRAKSNSSTSRAVSASSVSRVSSSMSGIASMPSRNLSTSRGSRVSSSVATTRRISTGSSKAAPTASSKRNYRVAVVGAAGGIGQPLSLLLKTNYTGLITSLSLYDVAPVTPGVAADLSHIPTSVKVDSYVGEDKLRDALSGADIVVVPAGVPRKPGMTRDDLFNTNANINRNLALAAADACPKAMHLIISNPVNSTVPIWAETLKSKGVYDPRKLLGVTSLDIFRANTFASSIKESAVHVPVVGGHAGTTIVPLFSIASQRLDLEGEFLDAITKRVMFGGDEVVQAKGGAGSATLSMAAAGARFTESCLVGLSGKSVINEIAFVENPAAEAAFGTRFFASELDLGRDGVATIHPTWTRANAYETAKINEMVGDLRKQIEKGEAFARDADNKH